MTTTDATKDITSALVAANYPHPEVDNGDFRVVAFGGSLAGRLEWDVDGESAAVNKALDVLKTVPGCRVTISMVTQITVSAKET